MLCAIRQSDNKKVLARDESKSNKPFFCPICSDEAILKKGTVKVHHFAHKPPVTCEYGRGEAEEHRMCKMEIFEGLKEHRRFRDVELEKGMGTVRPDVSALMDDIPIAVEVQISTLTMDQIVYRTSEYARKGIYLLWLPIYSIYLETDRYSPKLGEMGSRRILRPHLLLDRRGSHIALSLRRIDKLRRNSVLVQQRWRREVSRWL